MKQEQKGKFLINYGLREEQTFSDIENLVKRELLPDNRNEIARRGIHSARYLAEVDEQPMLQLLSLQLRLLKEDFSFELLSFAKDLSVTIFSIMIVKYGLSRAEMFDTIRNTLQLLVQITSEKFDHEKNKKDLDQNLDELANSIDTVFLKTKDVPEWMDPYLKLYNQTP